MSNRKITKYTNSYCSKCPKWTLDLIFSKISTQLGEETEDTSDTELNIDVPKSCEDSHECKSETGNNKKKDSSKSIIKTNKCIVNVSKSGRSSYVCELCFKFKYTIAKTMSCRVKIPAICTANGTTLRLSELQEHLSSEIHIKYAMLKMFRSRLMLKGRQKQKSVCVFQIRMQLFVIELTV